jgi:2-methylcitrate dehydratase PrpD
VAEVREVVIRLSHSEAKVVDNREMPDISIQHMAAVMLLDGTASFAAAHDRARMADPAVLQMKSKIRLVRSDELEKLEPERVAIVEITLNDGSLLSERVDAVRGTVSNPMTRAEVVDKARDLMSPVIGEAGCSRLIDALLDIERIGDVRQLRKLLQKA